MLQYEYPIFDFSAPIEFATRAEEAKSKNPPYRTDFMRDRDRVMYSGSFRRLAGKHKSIWRVRTIINATD